VGRAEGGETKTQNEMRKKININRLIHSRGCPSSVTIGKKGIGKNLSGKKGKEWNGEWKSIQSSLKEGEGAQKKI